MGYNPSVGQFVQRDPIGYADSLNLNEYQQSDPVGNVDPNGTTVYVDDVGPYGALGHWRTGNGEGVAVTGPDFINHVKNIPEVRSQIDAIKKTLETNAQAEGKKLAPGECRIVTLRTRFNATMTGYRWGAFGTIYHDVDAQLTVCKSKCGTDVTTSGEHLKISGSDTYHSFDTTPWGFRHVWYGINAAAGTVRELSPHAPKPYTITWSWQEPAPPPELHPAP